MEQAVGSAAGGVFGVLPLALIGLVIGAVAKLLMPGRDPGGWFVTKLIAAVLGAMQVLVIYRVFPRRRSYRP